MTTHKPEEEPLFKPIGIRIVGGGEITPYKDDPDSVVERLLRKPVFLHLFTDGPDRVFDPNALTTYLRSTFGPNFTAINHGDFAQFILSQRPQDRQEFISKLAQAKTATAGVIPLSDEEKINLEEQALDRDPAIPFRDFAKSQPSPRRYDRLDRNVYYETSALGSAFLNLLPEEMRTPHEDRRDTIVVVTGRGVGNMERSGLGFQVLHMRGGFSYGNVAVASTTGLVEAPGKPLELNKAHWLGGLPMLDNPEHMEKIHAALRANGNVLDHEIIAKVIEEIFEDKMLHYEDPRLNEAIKGLVLSMSLFALGEHGRASQCSSSDLSLGRPDTSYVCRLHDGHWQEEIIATQIKKLQQPEFCDYHTEIFKKLQGNT